MFCPTCGAQQSETRKFCTSCGTNLLVVSQVLSGRTAGLQPAPANLNELARQRDLARGVKMTVIGGAFLAIQFFSFVFSLPFRTGGSPFGFFSFVALIFLAVGISKLASARAIHLPQIVRTHPNQAGINHLNRPPAPRPVIEERPVDEPARTTGSLAAQHPAPSVTEEDTQHLPAYAPPRDSNS
jgi:hypothetical protein